MALGDHARDKLTSGVVVLTAAWGGKATLIATVLVLLYLDPVLFRLSLVFFPFAVIISRRFAPRIRERAKAIREENANLGSTLFDSILAKTARREAFSVPKQEALGYDPLEEMEKLRSEVVEAGTQEDLFYALVRMSNAQRDRHLGRDAEAEDHGHQIRCGLF